MSDLDWDRAKEKQKELVAFTSSALSTAGCAAGSTMSDADARAAAEKIIGVLAQITPPELPVVHYITVAADSLDGATSIKVGNIRFNLKKLFLATIGGT